MPHLQRPDQLDGWIIAGTDVRVWKVAGDRWGFNVEHQDRRTREWLQRNELLHARFPSRAAALRAFDAAAALRQPPSTPTLSVLTKLRRERAGLYRVGRAIARRSEDGTWRILWHNGTVTHCRTLRHCQNVINAVSRGRDRHLI